MPLFHLQDGIPTFKNAVITIGSFDGVHLGHKKIIETLISIAKQNNGESVVVTFHPHPRKIISPDVPIQLIAATSEKYEQLFHYGIDHIIEVPFTRDFSLLSAEDYVLDFLLQKIKPHTIVIGYDHHFGHDRKGDIQLLKSIIQDKATVIEIPEQLIQDANISSTAIRKALLSGQVDKAAKMLGRPYQFCGWVVHGNKLGRTIGFPTANIKPKCEDQLLPPIGIYAAYACCGDKTYKAAVSIGRNPTVTDDSSLKYEAFLLDFDGELYGQELCLKFIQKIRDEQQFENIDVLKKQIAEDVAIIRDLLD